MNTKKIHLLAVDMGYGHQRAAYPLIDDSFDGIVTVNNYRGIPKEERDDWKKSQKTYEKISYFKKTPLIGEVVFSVMDSFQKIDSFYPRRDLSHNSSQQLYFYRKVKKGLGKNLIEKLNKNPLPLITTFFVAAYFAEYYSYNDKIYLIVCDSDIARAWGPVNPKESRIIYLAPNQRVVERLMLYGVDKKNIKLTGFPLPKENVGEKREIIKKDLGKRLSVLDPKKKYYSKYKETIKKHLGEHYQKDYIRPISITFAVGGAGAQRELGATILKSLSNLIKQDKVYLNLVAGSRKDVYDFFADEVKKNSLDDNKNVNIVYKDDKMEYFKEFNKCLRNTDVLWTKPSELSFYSALGLPLIISTPIGSQEDFNKDWLSKIGAGIAQDNPKYVNEWLFDWLDEGYLAQAAMNGYLNAENMGTYNIEKLILNE